MQTGDIILSTGQSYVSFIVRSATKSAWSHAALVVWLDKTGNIELNSGPGRQLCVLDIGGRPTTNLRNGECTSGVRIVKWTDALSDYTCAAHLALKPIVKRDEYFLARTREFILSCTNGEIKFSQYRAFQAWWSNIPPADTKPNEVYCTEILAQYVKTVIWNYMSSNDLSFPSGMVTPHTFTELTAVYHSPYVIHNIKTVTAEEKIWLTWLLFLIIFLILVWLITQK